MSGWFRSMTIGKKLSFGFAMVLVLLAVVSAFSVRGISGMSSDAKAVIEKNTLTASLSQREIDHLNWAGKVSALFTDEDVTSLDVQTDPTRCAFGKWYHSEQRVRAEELIPGLADVMARIEEPHRRLHDSAKEIDRTFRQANLELGRVLAHRKADHLTWLNRVADGLMDASVTRIDIQDDPTRCALGKWLSSPGVVRRRESDPQFAQMLDRIVQPHERLHTSIQEINALLAQGKRDQAIAVFDQRSKPAAEETIEPLEELIAWNADRIEGMQQASHVLVKETQPALHDVQELLREARDLVDKEVGDTNRGMLHSASVTNTIVVVVSLAAVLLGIVLAYVIGKSIVSALKQVIEGLSDGSEQTTSASGQVAASSQSLAEGASEQAASIEEITSSVEEISSMVKNSAGATQQVAEMSAQNTANAREANSLMTESAQLVDRGQQSMGRLSTAVDEIKGSSEQTAKIIKTIDEIAFQTNLLALNAAVEAARAGDAGKGFAVVAEEVRNLAARSAEAARNTASLIEQSLKNADNGVTVASETAEALTAITESSQKVATLIGEISAASEEQTRLVQEVSEASGEQAKGVEQISSSVAQMDKVTQANAATAEESASAAEELSSQAEELNRMVGDLQAMVTKKAREERRSRNYEGNASCRSPDQADEAHRLRRPQIHSTEEPSWRDAVSDAQDYQETDPRLSDF